MFHPQTTHPGIPLPPSMALPPKKPDQLNNNSHAETEAALTAMAMFPGAPFPGTFLPNGQTMENSQNW